MSHFSHAHTHIHTHTQALDEIENDDNKQQISNFLAI